MKRKVVIALLLLSGFFWLQSLYSCFSLPDCSKLREQNPASTAFMRRYNGEKPIEYQWLSYTEISPYLKQAAVIAEDSNFFNHRGVDWAALWEAMKKNLREWEWKWGGSTITQQLAKNLYLSPSKNPFRKIKEIFIALELEQTLSKQRILEIYLNIVEWGHGIYGAEAAARYYFGTSAASLSPYQSAKLAAMLPRPRYFQRKFNSPHLEERTLLILKRMGY